MQEENVREWRAWGQETGEVIKKDFANWNFDKVTVVICCKNKAKELRIVLPALANQVLPADLWILADDYSTDESIEYFTSFVGDKGITFKVVQPPRQGIFQLNTLRNLGFSNSLLGVVIVIDADLIVGPGFVQAHLRLHADSNGPVSSVGPLFEAFDETGDGPINFMWGHEGWAHVNHSSLGCVPTWATVLGGNLGLHKRTWELTGEFDDIYDGNYGVDDQDLHYRLHLAGVVHKGHFDAHVIHLPHDNAVSSERRGDINQRKFTAKYGISVYERDNIPEPIDWLGWQQGPWNKVAKRLISGSSLAVTKRGTYYVQSFHPKGISPSKRHRLIFEQLIDWNYINAAFKTKIDASSLMEDSTFFDVGPNSLVDMAYIREAGGDTMGPYHPFLHYIAENLLERLGPSHLFNEAYYKLTKQKQGVKLDETGLFSHFWLNDRDNGVSPHPLLEGYDHGSWTFNHNFNLLLPHASTKFFDIEYYERECGAYFSDTETAVRHYLAIGRFESKSPNKAVNLNWLRKKYANEIGRLDPFTWLIIFGLKIGAMPNPTTGSFSATMPPSIRELQTVNSLVVTSV